MCQFLCPTYSRTLPAFCPSYPVPYLFCVMRALMPQLSLASHSCVFDGLLRFTCLLPSILNVPISQLVLLCSYASLAFFYSFFFCYFLCELTTFELNMVCRQYFGDTQVTPSSNQPYELFELF